MRPNCNAKQFGYFNQMLDERNFTLYNTIKNSVLRARLPVENKSHTQKMRRAEINVVINCTNKILPSLTFQTPSSSAFGLDLLCS